MALHLPLAEKATLLDMPAATDPTSQRRGSSSQQIRKAACGYSSQVRFNATAGETYYFMVAGYGGGGNPRFSLDVAPPPLAIDLTIDQAGSVVPTTGVATVRGIVTCNRPTYVYGWGSVQQKIGQGLVNGYMWIGVYCADPSLTWGALRSVVDYTLSHTLESGYLSLLAPHQLSLKLVSDGNTSHTFQFYGTGEFKGQARFDGQRLQDHIKHARGALRRVAWGDNDPWQGQAYRYAMGRTRDDFQKDLVSLAITGYRIYDDIIGHLAGDRDHVRALASMMLRPGLVQLALGEPRWIVPVAMIYDYRLDTGRDDYSLCPTFLQALDRQERLDDLECFKGMCPSRDNKKTVCPSGFWGYRHILGMPMSVGSAADVPPEIAYDTELHLLVSVSTDPDFVMRESHENVLRQLKDNVRWEYATTRESTLQLLRETSPHLVYFYCHGGVEDNIPYIRVGRPDELGITRDNIRSEDIYWEEPRPLVFINGCRTTALEPEMALEFVSAFIMTAGASGVIGSEITVFEPLATRFAEECLRSFIGGASIGEAVRGARLALLKEGNPLGLAYMPFAMASLHLAGVAT